MGSVSENIQEKTSGESEVQITFRHPCIMLTLLTTKLRNRSAVWATSKRLISTSGGRHKAVKNWTRPSIAEMGVPKEPWQQVHSRNQKKYNMHLVAGAGAIAVSLFALNVQVNFNPTPKYLKDVKFSTKTPKELTSLSAQQEEDAESPVEIVEKVVEAVEVVTEAVEEVVEVVKETLDVVKETIEKADEVVEEVKKIEDETKEIIQEGTQLVEDVKEVIEEGKEIVTEVAEVVTEALSVGSGEKEQVAEVNGSSMFKSVKAEEIEEQKIESVAQIEKPVYEEEKKIAQEVAKAEEVEEPKVEFVPVADIVAQQEGTAQIEKPVKEEEKKIEEEDHVQTQVKEDEKKIEQEALNEETSSTSLENYVTQATQVTQNEEVIKPKEEKELAEDLVLAKIEPENKIEEEDVVIKPKNEVAEPQKELVEKATENKDTLKEENTEDSSLEINAELTKPVELADEKVVQSNETKVEEAIHIEPVANTEGVPQKSDIKEEVKSEETS